MPKLTSNISISYGAENAALIGSQAQFAQLSFTARKQYAFVQISNELIRDSNPAAEQILTGNASRYIALDRDFQTLMGNGQGGAPVGLFNQVNVPNGATFTATGVPAFGDFLKAIDLVENLNNSTNVPVGQGAVTGIVGPANLKLQVASMKDTAGGRPLVDFGLNQMHYSNRPDGSSVLDGLFGVDRWVLSNVVKNTLNSTPAQVTTSLNPGATRGTQSPVFFGDWQHLIVMERQDVEIVTSNVAGTSFQNDQTWVRLITRYDVGVAHPEAFYVVTNG